MKVALLKSHMNGRGGLEKATVGLIMAFARKGADVTLLTTDAKGSNDIPAQIVNLGYRSKFSLQHHKAFDKAAEKWLELHPQDIVFGLDRNQQQTHYRAGSGVHAAYLARRMPRESLLKRLSLKLNPLHRFMLHQEKKAFTSPYLQTLFTNSEMVKQELKSYYDVPDDKLHVIPNGVDWRALAEPFSRRTRSDTFRFLFVGNGYKRKGLLQILEALPHLSSFNFEVHVVGKDKKRYRAPSNVIFHGPTDDLIPFYQNSDALLIPSIYDPFANVTIEALAMGLFVVSSSFNGGHEILTPESGVTIDNLDDPAEIAQAMRLAIAMPHDPTVIRNSVQGLDFSRQLDKIAELTLHG